MTLPNFVGIGSTKCGTTWLHELLKQHPKIYVPEKRKEINFFNFDENYQKGLSWYESFFPDPQTATQYQAIGEFTPRYLDQPAKCAPRMASVESIDKIFVMFRNPVNRVYSQYGHAVRAGYNKSFEDFLLNRPWVVEHSLYANHLEPFLEVYDRQQICCIIFERSVSDLEATKHKVADFLGVSAAEFPDTAGLTRVNQSYVPKFSQLNQIASSINQYLFKHDLDWVINLADSLGIRQLLKMGAQQKLPPMQDSTRLRLQDNFQQDIAKLESVLNTDLAIWRSE